MIVWILMAAGAALLFWPPAKETATAYSPPPVPSKPTYLDAVSAIQIVRHRLVETEQLSEPQAEAIDVLTLALVRGSER